MVGRPFLVAIPNRTRDESATSARRVRRPALPARTRGRRFDGGRWTSRFLEVLGAAAGLAAGARAETLRACGSGSRGGGRRGCPGALRRLDAWLDGRGLQDATLAAYLAELTSLRPHPR